MPLPDTARFARQNDKGEMIEFDSPQMVVDVRNQAPKLRDADGPKQHFNLRMSPLGVARLMWLADYLEAPATTLARELLEAATVQGLDSLNILEESKADVEAEIEAKRREILGEAS